MKFYTGVLMMNFINVSLLDGVDQLQSYKSAGSCCRHGSDYKCRQDLAANPEEFEHLAHRRSRNAISYEVP